MHFMGAPGAIDMRQRDSGTAGAAYLQHPRGGDMARAAAAAAGNMGAVSMPAATSAARTGRDGYADVAVARQCEREDCTVQPSYGKVWKKVRARRAIFCVAAALKASGCCCCCWWWFCFASSSKQQQSAVCVELVAYILFLRLRMIWFRRELVCVLYVSYFISNLFALSLLREAPARIFICNHV